MSTACDNVGDCTNRCRYFSMIKVSKVETLHSGRKNNARFDLKSYEYLVC